jgi:hypothetical protein
VSTKTHPRKVPQNKPTRIIHSPRWFLTLDDFCRKFEQYQKKHRVGLVKGKREPKAALSLSENMTIIIHFQQSNYRHFKAYYTEHVMIHLQSEFPNLVSYNRFIELMPGVLWPLLVYLSTRLSITTGIAFIDSTPLPVSHNRRIDRHKVFAGLAARDKTSMGWFCGFKLHLIVNDQVS